MARVQHKFHYIYKTICTVTNRYYIGMHSTSNLEDEYLGSGQKLWKSINKFGRDKHIKEILEFLPDRESLKTREREIINISLLLDPMCMNSAFGGQGGFISPNQARRGAIAMNKKNWSDPQFIERAKSRISNISKDLHKRGIIKAPNWTGKNHSDETKKKIGLANSKMTGNKNSQFGKKWIFNPILRENKKINSSDLESFLKEGWILGRRIKI
jgi:hypothetical protein